MEIGNIIPHIEALIFASDKPLTSMEITELINNAFGFMEEKLTLEQIQTSIDGIREKYASEFYPFEVRESGGGWQFLTKRDFHKTVAQLNGEKFLKRLSSAAMETLAIIAYKQPITKGEIEAIRGVSSDYSIQKLLEKELIVISGRNEDMPGKPLVYITSKSFMDYFGINSAADLPKLKEIFNEQLVEPTIIKHSPGETISEEVGEGADGKPLIVSEQGELIEHDTETGAAEGSFADEGDVADALHGETQVEGSAGPLEGEDATSEGSDEQSEGEDATSEGSDEQSEGDDDDLEEEEHDAAEDESDEDEPEAGEDDQHHDPAEDESDEDPDHPQH